MAIVFILPSSRSKSSCVISWSSLNCPANGVKVLILGQDPYHGKGQAHGYSFSVPKGVAVPPSLKNIFKEANITSSHGDLTNWASQGVMLLNTVLTVEENKPKSHSRKGWQILTRRVLELLVEHNENLVVMLWGRDAQNQVSGLNFKQTQLVLKAAHPSPLGAHHSAPVPFIGCGHFEKANKLGIINSAIGIDLGGIGIAVTKMAIASKKGLTIDLKLKNKISVDQFLFSETQSRILVSLKKNKLPNFKKIFKASDYTIIGKCTGSDVIEFKDNKKIMRGKISDFAKSYKQNIKGL